MREIKKCFKYEIGVGKATISYLKLGETKYRLFEIQNNLVQFLRLQNNGIVLRLIAEARFRFLPILQSDLMFVMDISFHSEITLKSYQV